MKKQQCKNQKETDHKDCKICNGKGFFIKKFGHFKQYTQEIKCNYCNGTGKFNYHKEGDKSIYLYDEKIMQEKLYCVSEIQEEMKNIIPNKFFLNVSNDFDFYSVDIMIAGELVQIGKIFTSVERNGIIRSKAIEFAKDCLKRINNEIKYIPSIALLDCIDDEEDEQTPF